MAVQTISPRDAFDRRGGKGKPVQMIDVRSPAEYAAVHAEGARLVSLDQVDPMALRAGGDVSPDEPVYVICKAGGRAFDPRGRAVGGGGVRAGVTDWCGMGLLLERMQWNRAKQV
jgi:rhodanese-related sulfurtransferase